MLPNRTEDTIQSLDEAESKPAVAATGEIITQLGRPPLDKIHEWSDEGVYVTFLLQDCYKKTTFQVTDIIRKINLFGSSDDALIWLNNFPHGLYVRHILQYSYPNNRELILKDGHSVDEANVITIKVADAFIEVNKPVLVDRSVYFANVLKHGTRGAIERTIDLSEFFNKNRLRVLFKFLDNRYQALRSSDSVERAYYSHVLKNIVCTFLDSLDLLTAAYLIRDDEIVESALKISRDWMSDWQLEQIMERPFELHPIILNWLRLIVEYKSKYRINDLDFLRDSFHASFLAKNHLLAASQHLTTLTGIQWDFDKIYLKSNQCYNHRPQEPNHPHVYAYKAVQSLASKQIIKIKDKPDVENHFSWYCTVMDESSLLTLTASTLFNHEQKNRVSLGSSPHVLLASPSSSLPDTSTNRNLAGVKQCTPTLLGKHS